MNRTGQRPELLLLGLAEALLTETASAGDRLVACDAVAAAGSLGMLCDVPASKQAAWAGALQDLQDQRSGSFSFQGHPVEAAADQRADWEATSASLRALRALGVRPLHGLRFIDAAAREMLVKVAAVEESFGPTRDASFLLTCLIHSAEIERNPHAMESYHRVLDALQQGQDPDTGLWGSIDSVDLQALIEHANRIAEFFFYAVRPLQRVTRIVDSVLVRHDPTAQRFAREHTVQFAAAIQLLSAFARSGYAGERIREIVLASHATLASAYPDSVGPARVAAAMALASVARAYPDAVGKATVAETPWPGLGLHRVAGQLTEHDRSILPMWLRQVGVPRAGQEAPAISVVLPCYNLGRYLPEAIASGNAQTSEDLELLIVDDGSPDDFTRLALTELERRGFRVLRQPNSGVATARNNGIAQARGRYICCLDPDDALSSTFFAQAIEILDAEADVAVVSGWAKTFDEANDIFRYDANALPTILSYNPVVEPAVFRRSAWEGAGGYTKAFSATGIEDWDLSIGMLEQGHRAVVIQQVVWHYRIRPNQMSDGLYEPGTYGRLCRELAQRHPKLYRANIEQIVFDLNHRWAELRRYARGQERGVAWWQTQARDWRRIAGEREASVDELREWIQELTQAKQWLETEAARLNQLIGERDHWIGELSQAKAWLEAQISSATLAVREKDERIQSLEAWNEERNQTIRNLEGWTHELEGAKSWFEGQAASWNRTADRLEKELEDARAKHRALASEVANLQPDANLFRQLPKSLQKLWRRFKS